MADVIFRCCFSDKEKSQRAKSRNIDKQLAKEKMQFRRLIKILLLGTGESGKSTFLKQMRILHGPDFDEESVRIYKATIYGNVVKGTKVLVDARDKLCIPWGNAENEKHAKLVFGYENESLSEEAFLMYLDSVRELWNDSGIKLAFDRRREYQLGDSLRYFMEELDRIGKKGFTPTKKDILHSRRATKSIQEHKFNIKGVPFMFVDVGGQRSQRQKWYQCFEGVTSILFLTASSEYDQVLLEDRSVNRLVESCNIFETIINNKCFKQASIILFLNKTDLLEEKIKYISITDYFPEYDGAPGNLAHAQEFLVNMFDSVRRERSKPLFHHFTTAIDTEKTEYVFNAVRDTILQNNLETLMLH